MKLFKIWILLNHAEFSVIALLCLGGLELEP